MSRPLTRPTGTRRHSPRASHVHVAAAMAVALLSTLAVPNARAFPGGSTVNAASGGAKAAVHDDSHYTKSPTVNDLMNWEEGLDNADEKNNGPVPLSEQKFDFTGPGGTVTAQARTFAGFRDTLHGANDSWSDSKGSGESKYLAAANSGAGWYSFWSIAVKGDVGPATKNPRSFKARAQGKDPWALMPTDFASIPGPTCDLYIPIALTSGSVYGHGGISLHITFETADGTVPLLDVRIDARGVAVDGGQPGLSFFLQDSVAQGPPGGGDVPVDLVGLHDAIVSRWTGDSLSAPVNIAMRWSDVGIPTTPLADGSLAHLHEDTEAWTSGAADGFTLTGIPSTATVDDGAGRFAIPDSTGTVGVVFDPPGPGTGNDDVCLYAHLPGTWVLQERWDWNAGAPRAFVPMPGATDYRLVACSNQFPIHGQLFYSIATQAVPPAQPPTLPDVVLGGTSFAPNPFNPTLGLGGGGGPPVNVTPGLSLQTVPRYIGANHWQYLPVQVACQPDVARPWLYVGNDPNQALLQPTSVRLVLDGLFNPVGQIIPSLPISIDFYQGPLQLHLQATATYDQSGHVQFPPVNLGAITSQPYQLVIGVPGVPAPNGSRSAGALATTALPGYFSLAAVVVTNGQTVQTGVTRPAPATASLRLAPPVPNPFVASARLEFSTASRERVRVTVFDAAGRAVCALADGTLEPGTHHVTWNGRDASSREAPAGIYYARVETAREVATRRMSLVR